MAITQRMQARGLLVAVENKRFDVTPKGWMGLREQLGIDADAVSLAD